MPPFLFFSYRADNRTMPKTLLIHTLETIQVQASGIIKVNQ